MAIGKRGWRGGVPAKFSRVPFSVSELSKQQGSLARSKVLVLEQSPRILFKLFGTDEQPIGSGSTPTFQTLAFFVSATHAQLTLRGMAFSVKRVLVVSFLLQG